MNVLLLHLDGKLPNLALMRLAAFYRQRITANVELRRADNPRLLEPRLGDPEWDKVYGSLIFERTRPAADRVRQIYPHAVLGGTGWDVGLTLADAGISDGPVDYSDYPYFRQSMGFTQRGCRLRCSFCVVPKKEGAVRATSTVYDLWRGSDYPREILLLDNDFFGQPRWEQRIYELIGGNFKVSFNQGINARMLTDETAHAIASVDYRDDKMKTKRIYTAWDNLRDEDRLFHGLDRLTAYGVKPDHIMVYILVGYWPGETEDQREHRRRRLREFGARPYPMPFTRAGALGHELVGFQRWIIGSYDKPANANYVPWAAWKANGYRPEHLDRDTLDLDL